MLGSPRVHYRACTSTNDRARELATTGAPHGTLVTADEQTAGRGRQGRTWTAPPGEALLLSLVLRRYDDLLSIRAGLATADVVAGRGFLPPVIPLAAGGGNPRPATPPPLGGRVGVPPAGHPACGRQGEPPPGPTPKVKVVRVKWPNDVLIDSRKVAGILVEGRPQEGWAILGIGVNVAISAFPEELRETAGTLGLQQEDREPFLAELLAVLETRLHEPAAKTIDALRARDALLGREIRWAGGEGVSEGVDARGRLIVGDQRLESGEVHLL